MGYYSQLVDEWKGLIACIALDYAHISVRRIDLKYSDGKDIASTSNVYELKGHLVICCFAAPNVGVNRIFPIIKKLFHTSM